MLTLSSAYLSHLAGTVLELATCWKITRRDGQVFGFTDYVADLTVAGQLYESAVGYSATDIESSANLAVDNLDIQGIADSPSITEADLLAGLWDGATVQIFEVIYSDLSAGTRPLKSGRIGNITMGRSQFTAELRSLTQLLTATVIEVTSPTCRARLGDSRCTVDLGPLTVSGTVTTATSASAFADSTRAETAGYFDFGVVTWTSGDNDGLRMEIKTHASGGAFTLVEPMPYPIVFGDGYDMVPGCDGLLATCRDKYSNIENMQAEPYLPGQAVVLRGPT